MGEFSRILPLPLKPLLARLLPPLMTFTFGRKLALVRLRVRATDSRNSGSNVLRLWWWMCALLLCLVASVFSGWIHNTLLGNKRENLCLKLILCMFLRSTNKTGQYWKAEAEKEEAVQAQFTVNLLIFVLHSELCSTSSSFLSLSSFLQAGNKINTHTDWELDVDRRPSLSNV